MTLNNHRFTTLSADDVAMCRAHSDAVANEPDHVVWHRLHGKSDAQLAAECERSHDIARFEIEVCMPDDLPLPDSYWDDLEHWLKTLAPAKPAAPRPAESRPASAWRSGPTIPKIERVGLWHVRLLDGSSVGPARHATHLKFDQSKYRPAAPGTQAGDPYDESKYVTADLTARLASTSSADGAVLVGVKLTHSVCIKAHGFAGWQIGEICPGGPGEFAHPENWLPCDEDGWVPHTPTADSTCPVPVGIKYEARYGDGSMVSDTDFARSSDGTNLWRSMPGSNPSSDITAWRPIVDGGK